jgi:hypothetical protein
MLEAIRKMISDPAESWWVVDGALMTLKFAQAKDLDACKPLIMPWTKHDDWWLRESAFLALTGLEKDEALLLAVVPTLLTIMTAEYHTQPRARMKDCLERLLKSRKPESPVGRLVMAGLMSAVKESEVKAGLRSPEGAYNVIEVAKACLQNDPTTAVSVAQTMRERFSVFGTDELVRFVATPNSDREGKPYGLYTALAQQSPQQREALTDLLFNEYRQELIKRMSAEKEENQALVDTLIDLIQLRKPVGGWKPLGKDAPADRTWRFTSFDPQAEKDQLHPREKKRFRDVQLPGELKGWETVSFDDSKWQTGRAPIGIGVCKEGRVSFKNKSDWGKGEFLVMRTTFDLDAVDCDKYRLSILARQGFHVYLNGHRIETYVWWKDMPHYRTIEIGAGEVRYLKKGTNLLAAYGNVEYDQKTQEPRGQMDLFIEGLKMSDLKQ